MSLLKKASIITTPTAYAEDFLYNIKPAGGLGDELITNGTFDTDSNWNKGTGTTISGGKANFSSATSVSLYQNIGIQSGFVKVTFSLTDYTSGTLKIYIGGYSIGTSLIAATSVGSYSAIIDTSSGNGNIIFGSSDNFTGSIDNVSAKQVVDFSFDRNSTGTRVNEDYLIEDVPYNLASYSENISVWDNFRVGAQLSNIINPFGSGYVYLVEDGTETDNHYRKRPYIFLDSSGTYTQSFFVKKKDDGVYPVLRTSGVGGDSFVTFNWDTETLVEGSQITSSKVEKYNNGWYRISMVFSNLATTDFIIGISNDVNDDLPTYTGSNKGFYVWGCQIVKGDQPKDYLKTTDRLDIPRIDYTNGEPSILLEPSRTNLITYSNDFKNRWTLGSNTTVTENYAISPEGIQNASRIQTPSGAGSFASLAAPMSSGTPYAFSIYIKNNGGESLNIGIGSGATSGVDGAETIVTPTNEWVRYEVLFTADSNSNFVAIDNRSNTTALDCLIYGAQLEAGSYATSLIHTSGSAVTRSADIADNAGNSDLINSTEGVLYAEVKVIDTDSVNKMITLSNGTNSTRVLIRFVGTTLLAQLRISGSNQYEFAYTPSNITDNLKIAIKYKVNDFSLYVNGTQLNSSNSGNVFSSGTLTELAFDDGNGSNIFNGNVKMVAVFKEALTDLELEKLTGYNNHELYMNYYNRLSYLGLVEEYNVESDINNYIL